MLIFIRLHIEKYKKELVKLLQKLIGHELSMMGFMYYIECEKIDDDIICFNADIKKGTDDNDLILQAIENLSGWDGTIGFYDNLIYRNISTQENEKTQKLLDYFNSLPLSEIWLVDKKQIILGRKININIQYRDHKQLIPYNYTLIKQVGNVSYIEELGDFDSNLVKIELNFSIHPKNLYITVLNKAHFIEHILIQQIKSKTNNILAFNGFTTSTGFINVYIVFESIYLQEMYKILNDLLNYPLQEQDGIENIRLSLETIEDDNKLIQKMHSVLTAQFCFNDEIYQNGVDIKELSNIFHTYYILQSLCIQYSGNEQNKIDPTDVLNLKFMRETIQENDCHNTSTEACCPQLDLVQEKFDQYPLPKKIDSKFIDFLLYLDINNVQFTIYDSDIYIHQRGIVEKEEEYYAQQHGRFLDIGQFIPTQYLIDSMQTGRLIKLYDNKYISSLSQ